MQYVETPIEDAIDTVQRVSCQDGGFCPDGTTCCKLFNGKYGCFPTPDGVCCKEGRSCCPHGQTCCDLYGCCPYPKGVCCKDGIFCCPYGNQCDPQHPGGCIGSQFLPMLIGPPQFNNIYPSMEKVYLYDIQMSFVLKCTKQKHLLGDQKQKFTFKL